MYVHTLTNDYMIQKIMKFEDLDNPQNGWVVAHGWPEYRRKLRDALLTYIRYCYLSGEEGTLRDLLFAIDEIAWLISPRLSSCKYHCGESDLYVFDKNHTERALPLYEILNDSILNGNNASNNIAMICSPDSYKINIEEFNRFFSELWHIINRLF